jgi:effector-binding domain-containing protein
MSWPAGNNGSMVALAKLRGGRPMPDFDMIEVSETPYLYVSRTCSMDPEDISDSMGGAFGEVWRFMQSRSIAPAGGALSVYHEYHPERMAFRAGFVVDRADLSKATGPIEGDVTPAGQVLHFVHKGPYRTLRDDYGLMMQHIERLGRAPGAPTWEVYLNGPDDVPEDQLLTEVFCVLA